MNIFTHPNRWAIASGTARAFSLTKRKRIISLNYNASGSGN